MTAAFTTRDSLPNFRRSGGTVLGSPSDRTPAAPKRVPNPTMTPTSPSRAAAFAAAAALGTLLGCQLEPDTPELRYSLSDKVLSDPTYEEYALDGTAQDQLRGALEMLFGTPSNPGFLLTDSMKDEEFDPNYGIDELSEAQFEALVKDNQERFADDLAAIERDEFDAVRLPREALDLRADWEAALAELADLEAAGEEAAEELEEARAELKEEWPTYLAEYYPTLRESAEMYRTQCLHCHGVEGGGDGTTADFLNPRPRDYREGIFKFISVSGKGKPTRADLYRVLEEGIYTTAMPSFRRFSDAQLHGLVDYVRLLSIRGRVELLSALDYDVDEGGIPLESVIEYYDDEWGAWQEAPDNVVVYDGAVPRATPEMLKRGRELYFDAATANCVSCHGIDFRGNGPSAEEADPDTGELVPIKDEWGYDIAPRDLTRGVFRFGRRPIDIYRRIHSGINGTPMPEQTSVLKPGTSERALSDEDFWALTHYVRSLSVHPMEPASAPQEDGE